MNRCELSVSANASRRTPGVNVPLAAPSCPLDVASLASCCSDLPEAEGNWLATGCRAAASSSTAGAGFAAVVAEVRVPVAAGLALELCLAELPQAASPSAAATIARRRATTG